jgi:hypothetical protein
MAFLRDELKTLSVQLGPTHRVSGSETADVLSALIAYVENPGVLAAAQEGGQQGVADFYHDVLTQEASENGADPPVKGQPIFQQPAPGRQGPAPAVSKADFDKLAASVAQLVAALTPQQPAEPEPVTPDQYAAQERAQGFPN